MVLSSLGFYNSNGLKNSKNVSWKFETSTLALLTLKKKIPKSSIHSEKWTLQCWPHLTSQCFLIVMDFSSSSGFGGHVQNFGGP